MNDFIISHAGDEWVYLLAWLVCIIDGFFPPIPSESVIVGLSAVSVATGAPDRVLLAGLAALGAFLGDNIAYSLGRLAHGSRLLNGGRRREKARDFAREHLKKRDVLLILCARFIPVGRVAVNVTAGATGYSRGRFVALTAFSGITWGVYSVGIGSVAGRWFEHNPLLAATIGIFLAVMLGLLINALLARVFRPSGSTQSFS